MPLGFLGQLPPSSLNALHSPIEVLRRKIAGMDLRFSTGALKIVQRTNSQLAIVFAPKQAPPELVEALTVFKNAVYQLGVKPEPNRDITNFLPHISIAHVAASYTDNIAHQQLARFLSEDLTELTDNLEMPTRVDVFEIIDAGPEHSEEPRYRALSTAEDTL